MTKGNSNRKADYSKTLPVFRIKPINKSNTGIVKFVGYVNENEKLGDEEVELGKTLTKDPEIWGKESIEICNIDGYQVMGRLYRSNLIGNYVVSGSRYPVIYLSVLYYKNIVSGSLLQYYISLDISPETKKEITKPVQYVNKVIDGTYVEHIDCDKEFIDEWRNMTLTKVENDIIKKHSKKGDESNEEELDVIFEEIENEMKEYDNIMSEKKLPRYENFETMKNKLIDLTSNERFLELIKVALRCRVIQRRNEQGITEEAVYEVPKEYKKMSDIKQQLIESGELAE